MLYIFIRNLSSTKVFLLLRGESNDSRKHVDFSKNVQFIDASMHFRALKRKNFFTNFFEQSEKIKIGFKIIVGNRGLRRFREDHVIKNISVKSRDETTNI